LAVLSNSWNDSYLPIVFETPLLSTVLLTSVTASGFVNPVTVSGFVNHRYYQRFQTSLLPVISQSPTTATGFTNLHYYQQFYKLPLLPTVSKLLLI